MYKMGNSPPTPSHLLYSRQVLGQVGSAWYSLGRIVADTRCHQIARVELQGNEGFKACTICLHMDSGPRTVGTRRPATPVAQTVPLRVGAKLRSSLASYRAALVPSGRRQLRPLRLHRPCAALAPLRQTKVKSR